jgi:hypothetical protein
MILVGDSLNMSFAGQKDTLSATLEQMIYHTNAVCRGAKNSFVVCDMPFGTYSTKKEALKNAIRVFQQTPADCIKIEGGKDKAKIVKYLTSNGIAVCGHIGLLPQSVRGEGGLQNLFEADIIVTGGRGSVGDEMKLVKELADALNKQGINAEWAVSRPVVDEGLAEYARQVGQTGKTVRPKVYVAVGVSGAVQHIAGMKESETIVAINHNAKEAIFGNADFGIVGNYEDILPELIEKVKLILNSPDLWKEYSLNARDYYLKNHSPDVVMPKFERAFLAVVKL